MRPLLFAGLVLLSCSTICMAKTWSFDPTMLEGDGTADISIFNQGSQLPGVYSVDIYLNADKVDSQDISFSVEKDKAGHPFLYPCIALDKLSSYGVKTENFPELSSNGTCVRLTEIPQATFDFQFEKQALIINIPQIYLRPKEQGIASQQLWDDGIPALLMNYSANTSRSESRYNNSNDHFQSSFIQLNPGANIGPWRLRNQSNWQHRASSGGDSWQTVYTYAERGVNSIKSRLVLGDRNSPGDIFDSVPFRGTMLGSDSSMVPWNMRAYAPIVRGVARTQARVEVKQNGYLLYSETVAPGPFALTDLLTSGLSGGNLQVSIRETDGSTQVFDVPYQTPAIALKEGYLDYSALVGKYRFANSSTGDTFGQVTAMYGLPWNITAYGGAQGSHYLNAWTAGLGVSLGDFGALSLDGTLSSGELYHSDEEKGGTWHVRYSKNVDSTNTSLMLSSYQYASSGYHTLSDVMNSWKNHDNHLQYGRLKSLTSLTLSQSLGTMGYLSFTGNRGDYRDREGHQNSFNTTYSVALYRSIMMSFSWSQNKQKNYDGRKSDDRITSLWINVPLDTWTRNNLGSNLNASYRLTSPSQGGSTQELGLSGDGFDQQLHWDIRQSHQSSSNSNDSDYSYMNAGWLGTYGELAGNYSYSTHRRDMGVSVAGGAVLHEHGLTLGQTLGDTIALVEAPGASSVSVSGGRGVKTDFRGYTVQSWVTPYQENTISLDPLSLPDNAEINQTDVKIVPTSGAILPARFPTRIGRRVLMAINHNGGRHIPLGAQAKVKGQAGIAGIAGMEGDVYLTGLPQTGVISVNWTDNECHVSYSLPKDAGLKSVYTMNSTCR